MPVYAWPDLLEDASPELRKRMQGKSCFNFTTVDEALLAELAELTRRAFRRMQDSGAESTPAPGGPTRRNSPDRPPAGAGADPAGCLPARPRPGSPGRDAHGHVLLNAHTAPRPPEWPGRRNVV
jgi:hypothetical protein